MNRMLFLSVFFIITSCSNKKDKIFPTKRPLTESVYSSVTIQPDSLYQYWLCISVSLFASRIFSVGKCDAARKKIGRKDTSGN